MDSCNKCASSHLEVLWKEIPITLCKLCNKIKKWGHLQCWIGNNNVEDSLTKTLDDRASTRRTGHLDTRSQTVSQLCVQESLKAHHFGSVWLAFWGIFYRMYSGLKESALLGFIRINWIVLFLHDVTFLIITFSWFHLFERNM